MQEKNSVQDFQEYLYSYYNMLLQVNLCIFKCYLSKIICIALFNRFCNSVHQLKRLQIYQSTKPQKRCQHFIVVHMAKSVQFLSLTVYQNQLCTRVNSAGLNQLCTSVVCANWFVTRCKQILIKLCSCNISPENLQIAFNQPFILPIYCIS